jgi:hypothetical protein
MGYTLGHYALEPRNSRTGSCCILEIGSAAFVPATSMVRYAPCDRPALPHQHWDASPYRLRRRGTGALHEETTRRFDKLKALSGVEGLALAATRCGNATAECGYIMGRVSSDMDGTGLRQTLRPAGCPCHCGHGRDAHATPKLRTTPQEPCLHDAVWTAANGASHLLRNMPAFAQRATAWPLNPDGPRRSLGEDGEGEARQVPGG